MSNDYAPAHVEIVDLPKDEISVRPLARLRPEHRLVYDAAVFAAANSIESAIPRGVYSYRWWKKQQRLVGPGKMWITMQRVAKSLHQKKPSLLLARTDVAAFYEHIEVDQLIEDLSGLNVPAWSIEVLETFLRAFNGLSHAWGLPQGPDSSGILANLYLIPLDMELARRGYRHFRYSDDMYIFANDWIALREIIVEANKLLRYRHLNLAGNKTKIIKSRDVPNEFEDSEKDAISYGISVADDEAADELRAFFDKVVTQEPVRVRDLKFSLGKFKLIKDDYAVKWFLANMGEVPHLAREALAYLSLFHKENPEIGDAVVDLLTNSKLFLYPYAEQHLLIYMIQNAVQSKPGVKAAWDLLLDRNKESFVREFAARYLGLYGLRGGASRIKQEFQQEQNHRVRRALLIACYEAGQCSNQWLSVIAESDPELRLTVEYLKQQPHKIPVPTTGRKYDFT
ncbi:RNA-directed DNA polymerase [Streptosporangium sp. NPDC000095]|uniref:RNA-directed DNA polymerase n=1 Tax=Streptosporangium sp. NPDC000095 TaxID=3366184 RepID=UPI0036A9C02C